MENQSINIKELILMQNKLKHYIKLNRFLLKSCYFSRETMITKFVLAIYDYCYQSEYVANNKSKKRTIQTI